MKSKAVIPRETASKDVDEAIDHSLGEGAFEAALDFTDALETGYAHIARQPGSGSPKYAHELNLPGLRFWPLTRFPFLVFYFEQDDFIDVWRVLHEQRDIPASFR